jgi:O-antigen ligase
MAAAAVQGGSPVLHYLLMVYLFLYSSRLPEFIPSIRVMAPLLLVLLAAMAITLRFVAIVQIPGGRLLLATCAWSILCVPFSIWPGGTIRSLETEIRTVLIVAMLTAFIRTVPQALRALYVFGLAMAFAASMSFVFGSAGKNAGRLELAGSGTLGDPNYYCYYVLAGLPFLCAGAVLTRGIKRIAFLLLIIPILTVIGRTGSRMGAIALVAGLVFLFFVANVRQKIVLIIAVGGLSMIAAATLPQHLLERFTTIFESDEDTVEAQMAIGSTQSRKYLFFRSLDITAEYPIFGAGPGLFPVAENGDAQLDGEKGAWHATHNTYTQYSSEIGIPGALLFMLSQFFSYAGLNKLRKRATDERIRCAALFTQMSFVMVCASLCFLSVGYGGLPYVLIGISGALQVAVANAGTPGIPGRPMARFTSS